LNIKKSKKLLKKRGKKGSFDYDLDWIWTTIGIYKKKKTG
jgi:hypothetical protein